MTTRRKMLLSASWSLFWITLQNARAGEKFEVERSEGEWRKVLSPEQFDVLRQAGTERPFTSPLLNEHRRGLFGCAGCGQGDSVKAGEQPDGAISVVLKSLDSSGWRRRDGFEDFEDEAEDRENIAGRIVAAVRVAVFPERHVLMAMHDLDSPVLAVELQQDQRRGLLSRQAGDEMDDLHLRLLPFPVDFALPPARHAADLTNRRPFIVDAGGLHWEHLDQTPFDASMGLFGAAIVTREGEKSAR